MKLLLAIGLGIFTVSTLSFAADVCPETELVKTARTLDLRGKVEIKAVSNSGGGVETTVDQVVELPNGSQGYSEFSQLMGSDEEIISAVFWLKGESAAAAVTRNKATCLVRFSGTDGVDISKSSINKISKDSIQYQLGAGTVLTVKKVK